MVHVREIEGKPARFGHSGWLWFNAYLLYDHETGSLWHHLSGTALSGPRRGTRLRSLPTQMMTFAAWRAEHPETLVLAKPDPAVDSRRMDSDPYAARNKTMQFGYGIALRTAAGDTSRFYAFGAMRDGLAEDEVGGVPVVVVRDPGATTAFAYDRRVGGRTLSFERDTSGADARPILRERGGPRRWFARSGRPVAASASTEPGQPSLEPVQGSVWEAAAWQLQHRLGSTWAPPAAGTAPPGRSGR